LSYRVAVKSIERIADHACGIADKAIKLNDKVSNDSLQKIEKMSHIALRVLGDAVEALLRRDYHLADKTVDNVENVRSLEDDAISSIEKIKIPDQANIKLVLENIRRTAEYASDIAEAAMNDTIDEVIEKYAARHSR
jgi:phosphate uptake regulator